MATTLVSTLVPMFTARPEPRSPASANAWTASSMNTKSRAGSRRRAPWAARRQACARRERPHHSPLPPSLTCRGPVRPAQHQRRELDPAVPLVEAEVVLGEPRRATPRPASVGETTGCSPPGRQLPRVAVHRGGPTRRRLSAPADARAAPSRTFSSPHDGHAGVGGRIGHAVGFGPTGRQVEHDLRLMALEDSSAGRPRGCRRCRR